MTDDTEYDELLAKAKQIYFSGDIEGVKELYTSNGKDMKDFEEAISKIVEDLSQYCVG